MLTALDSVFARQILRLVEPLLLIIATVSYTSHLLVGTMKNVRFRPLKALFSLSTVVFYFSFLMRLLFLVFPLRV